MTVKFFVMAVCAAIGTVTGVVIMNGYKRRTLYFDGLCALVAELKRNISYRRDSARTILSCFTTQSDRLKKNIDEYVGYTDLKDGDPTLSRGVLNKDEYDKVNEFFTSLGKTDSKTQLDELDMYYSVFSQMKDRATENSQKFGPLAVKLGFLLGLGVGVLFL